MAENIIDTSMKKILEKGETVFAVYFRTFENVKSFINDLPYIKGQYPNVQIRNNTDIIAIDQICMNDNTEGFAVITGGDLSSDEFAKVSSLMKKNNSCSGSVIISPLLDEGVKKILEREPKKKWWQLRKKN